MGERRIPPEAFAAAARELISLGYSPVVTWGPGEEALARSVISGAPGAEWLRRRTSMSSLRSCGQPGSPSATTPGPCTFRSPWARPRWAFFLRIDMERWGHAVAPHRMVDLTPIVDGASGAGLEQRVAEEVRSFVAERVALTG